LPIVAIAIAAAGLRLSRTNVVVAGGIAAVVAVVAYVCDRAWNPTLTEEAPRHLVITLVLLGLATVVGVLAAARTRRVALEAAQQTLLAERARLHLGAYVSEEVAALSLKSDEVRLGGERLRCAVLFTDLRNFTGQSESADAQAMVSAINAYFEGMVACVKQHGGVVDKYIGDSLMAVFGAPTSRGNDAGNALRAAKAMRAALARLNADRSARGLAPLAHGIGVHFGEVVAGNIGTAERTQYTVIGDVVNVAARLESETKKAGVDVLVSKDVVDAAVAIDAAIDVDVVAVGGDDGIVVKGRAAPVRVFTIGGSA
jgi:adenylate cyclase